jgi:hypothetical protein
MIAMRPFSRCDWFGLAGAECFADGSDPLIGDLLIDGCDASVVLDATGLMLHWGNAHDAAIEVYWPTGDAGRVLALLPRCTSTAVIVALGGEPNEVG